MADITAIGEVLIDLTQCGVNEVGVPLYAANPGGAPANLAVAAARLGAKAAFIGKVGSDSYGTFLKKTLADHGVDVAGILTDPQLPTTLAVVSVNGEGERSFSFYRDPSADVNLRQEELQPEKLRSTRVLHFGSVSLTAEPTRSATLRAVSLAREQGAVISYDPNYRPSLWKSEIRAVEMMRRPLELVDILKVSDEELVLLAGTGDLEEGTQMLVDKGIPLVLVTLGPEGVFYRFRGRTGHVPGVPCRVGDTNGAGDTFLGAVLAQLVNRKDGTILEDLSPEELESILAYANRAASITTSRHGAIPAMPTWQEVFG